MLKECVINIVNELIQNEYSHAELPGTMYARITRAENQSDYYVYNLKILDENRNVNEEYAEIPNVRSKDYYETGSIVAIVLPYGKLNVFIVGEVV